jgi:hypothetical protein
MAVAVPALLLGALAGLGAIGVLLQDARTLAAQSTTR